MSSEGCPTRKVTNAILDANNFGLGDLTMFAWIYAGYKSAYPDREPFLIRCRNRSAAQILDLWGVPYHYNTPPPNLLYSFRDPKYQAILRSGKPWVEARSKSLLGNPYLQRPTPRWSEAGHEGRAFARTFAADRPLVVLAPSAGDKSREWPAPYWGTIAHALWDSNIATVTVGLARDRTRYPTLPNLWTGMSVESMAGILDAASLVVSNESGPAHISGTLGRPTLVLAGPTKGPHDHYPTTRTLVGDKACTSCNYQGDAGFHISCTMGCASLMTLTPEAVASTIQEILTDAYPQRARNQGTGDNPPPDSRDAGSQVPSLVLPRDRSEGRPFPPEGAPWVEALPDRAGGPLDWDPRWNQPGLFGPHL